MIRHFLRVCWRRLGLKAAWQRRQLDSLLAEWRGLLSSSEPRLEVRQAHGSLILPSDPVGLLESLGDQAMLSVVISHLRTQDPGAPLFVGTGSPKADAEAERLGCKPVRILDGQLGLSGALSVMRDLNCRRAVLIGADVLDGSLDPTFSGRLLAMIHLLGVHGYQIGVMGFSMGPNPHPGLRDIFTRLNGMRALNARDPVTCRRILAFTGISPNPVADLAFLLGTRESDSVQAIKNWIAVSRATGRRIVGLNLHPFPHSIGGSHGKRFLVERAAAIVDALVRQENIAVVLLSHDSRPLAGDHLVLDQLVRQLDESVGRHVHWPGRLSTPHETKAVLGALDLVVSGRMHLAISALSIGTPVLTIGGPEKLDGLLELFGLEPGTRISETQLLDSEQSARWIVDYLRDVAHVRSILREREPSVRAMARANFDGLQLHVEQRMATATDGSSVEAADSTGAPSARADGPEARQSPRGEAAPPLGVFRDWQLRDRVPVGGDPSAGSLQSISGESDQRVGAVGTSALAAGERPALGVTGRPQPVMPDRSAASGRALGEQVAPIAADVVPMSRPGGVRLSICIPTYRRSTYLAELLDSIEPQLREGVEVVVSDDHSPDDTLSVLASYQARLPGLKVIAQPRNLGLDRNFLAVVDEAAGEYVWLMGDDDRLEPAAVDRVLGALDHWPGVAGLTLGVIDYDATFSRVTGLKRLPETRKLSGASEVFGSIGEHLGFMSTLVIRRSLWQEVVREEPVDKFFNLYVQVFIVGQALRRVPEWGVLSDKCVGYRSENDQFIAKFGWFQRLQIDVDAYGQIADALFGNAHSRAKRAFLKRTFDSHVIARLINAKASTNPPEKMPQAYWLMLRRFGWEPSFWLKAVPIALIPRGLFRALRRTYRERISPARLKRVQAGMHHG